jgi:hypothetical protein
MRLGDSGIKPGQTARHEFWDSGSGTTGMEDEDGITLPECGKAWKGHVMGVYVVHCRGSSMCWSWAIFEETFERWVYNKRAGMCFAKQFIDDVRVG